MNDVVYHIASPSYSAYGGGLYNCRGIILNNTIYKNTSTSGGGGFHSYYDVQLLQNCIIWDNYAPEYPDIFIGSDETTSLYNYIENEGESKNTPAFPEFYDPDSGDFRLKSNSPCIDAGGYTSYVIKDILGNSRGFDGVAEYRGDGSDYDIGAYEYYVSVGEVSLTANPASGISPLEVNFVGEATAENCLITGYSWVFDVDINPQVVYVTNEVHILSTTSYTYLNPGTYNVRFSVGNNLNETQFVTQTINVYSPDSIFDLNEDGDIEIGDILEFIECWDKQYFDGDFNGDDRVDYLDLFYLANRWGVQFDKK